MSRTLYQLCETLARQMGDLVTGTPSSTPAPLKTDSFGCSKLSVYEDDYFVDWYGRVRSGTHKDTTFTITNFLQTNGVVTFNPALSTKIDTTDTFYMLPDFTPEELIAAINLALSMVEKEALQDRADVSLGVRDSVYEYLVPKGFLFIDKIYEEQSTADKYSPSADLIDERHWRILPVSPAKLWFDSDLVALTTGRNLRIVGQEAQKQLTLDADECDVNQTFLVYQAKALLHQSRIRGAGADFEEHRTQMELAQALADRERSHIRIAARGKKV